MKRICGLLLALLLVLPLTGCDPNAGKRPNNYPSTVWTCEAPAMVIYVRSDGSVQTEFREPCGRDPDTLTLAFDYGSGFYVREAGTGKELLYGNCTFSPAKVQIKVKTDELFDEAWTGKTITFPKADWPDSEQDALPRPTESPHPAALTGIWVNEGQYSEGHDFVETMTLLDDGTLLVHLDYQGSPYADLTGTWIAENGSLTFTLEDGTVRVYEYRRSGIYLTLTGNGKTVEYILQ